MIYPTLNMLHRIVRSRSPYQYFTPRPFPSYPPGRILALLLGALAGCAPPTSPASTPQGANSTSSAEAASSATTPIPFAIAAPSADLVQAPIRQVQSRMVWLVPPADPITVTRFRLDSQCQDFVAEPIQVSRADALKATVGRILSEQTFLAFDLAGYRVTVDSALGSVNIDLRLDPASERQLVSLSVCEQMSLFGSLRKTLMEGPDWRFQTVTFTLRGQPVVF